MSIPTGVASFGAAIIYSVVGIASVAAQITETKLTASDAWGDDRFGNSVSISGNRALVGARTDNDDGSDSGFPHTNSGSAYLFEQDLAGNWVEIAKLTASDSGSSNQFGQSVSLDGDRALVGAHHDDDKGTFSGSAYIFERNALGEWLEVAKLTASDGSSNEYFGSSVSLDGNRALVGAWGDSDQVSFAGAAYVFERDGLGNWSEVAKLTTQDPERGDLFGTTVSLDGERALVGCANDDDSGWRSGSAYLFEPDSGGAWIQVAKLLPSDGAAGDNFGYSVSLDGDAALIGANETDTSSSSASGAAYYFEMDSSGVWVEVAKLTASDSVGNAFFGDTLTLQGNRALIGAPRDASLGYAYLFERDSSGLWVEVAKLGSSDAAYFDRFGQASSLDGTRALVGAWANDDAGSSSGSAYVFEFEPPNNNPIADAGSDQLIECMGTLTSVQLDGSGSSDPDGDSLSYDWGVPAGVILDDPSSPNPSGEFPIGPSLLTLTVTDGNGGISCDDVLITIEDTTAPVVVCTTDLISLGPPNHKMRTVQISVAVTDECSDFELTSKISSSEPDDANGDGSFTGDVDGKDGYTKPVTIDLTYDPITKAFVGEVELRAERDGANGGRSYSIVCDVADFYGNVSTSSCVVVVPHDRRKAK